MFGQISANWTLSANWVVFGQTSANWTLSANWVVFGTISANWSLSANLSSKKNCSQISSGKSNVRVGGPKCAALSYPVRSKKPASISVNYRQFKQII